MSLDDYDGASAIAAAWADGLRPDPTLTVSAWADRHRVLSPRGANEAGPWRTSRIPHLKEIMDHLSPVDARTRINNWRIDYNQDRPHSAVRNLTPRAFAAQLKPARKVA